MATTRYATCHHGICNRCILQLCFRRLLLHERRTCTFEGNRSANTCNRCGTYILRAIWKYLGLRGADRLKNFFLFSVYSLKFIAVNNLLKYGPSLSRCGSVGVIKKNISITTIPMELNVEPVLVHKSVNYSQGH